MSTAPFEAWGIVELMGHQKAAGRLGEQQIGGANLLRVDIPQGEGFRTVYYGAGSIFALHVTDETTARAACERITSRPFYEYVLPSRQIAGPSDLDPDDNCTPPWERGP